MKKVNILMLILGVLSIAFVPPSNSFQFHEGPYFSAKELAAESGKLYMIDFTADWCLPCRWMEENTFSDPTLGQYIADNVVPVKVNIDDFDGFILKELYKVEILPTLIIFNSKGEVVKRIEESVDGTKLLAAFKSVDMPKNRIATKKEVPTTNNAIAAGNHAFIATEQTTAHKPFKEATTRQSKIVAEPATEYTEEILSAPVRPSIPNLEEKVGFTNRKLPREETAPREPIVRHEVKQEVITNLFEEEEKEVPTTLREVRPTNSTIVESTIKEGFGVQMGSFGSYSNALQMKSQIEKLGSKEVLMNTIDKNGTKIYKVMVGSYVDYEAANMDLALLRTITPGAFIKKLN